MANRLRANVVVRKISGEEMKKCECCGEEYKPSLGTKSVGLDHLCKPCAAARVMNPRVWLYCCEDSFMAAWQALEENGEK